MPVELSYNKISKRFDFGVPLEDIFAEGDVHPRLKFIFQQAFELYMESLLRIEDVLNDQLCLQECLELKEIIIYDTQPMSHISNKHIGAYFWIIRHFLGLLPIPLLPFTTSNYKYQWQELSRKCRNILKSPYRTKDQYNFLNYSISRSLNNLPEEHILLLTFTIEFIRKIVKKRFSKRTLRNLSVYFCNAIFIRPFIPGNSLVDEKMLPLLIYMVSKWNYIIKYLRIDYMPLFSHIDGRERRHTVNSSTQTTLDFLSINNKFSTTSVKCLYIKDVECQTDTNSEIKLTSPTQSSRNILSHRDTLEEISSVDNSKEFISANSFSLPLKWRRITSFTSSLGDINEVEETGNNIKKKLEYNRDGGSNIFNSTMKSDLHASWNDVVKEIQKTVKKVESYDYENECNSITSEDYKSVSSSTIESTFSSGTETDYISFRDSTWKTANNESVQAKESNKSFLVTSSCRKNTKNDSEQLLQKNQHSTSAYRSFYSSELYSFSHSCDDNWEEDGTSSNFSFKKSFINFNFFKTLSPRIKKSGKRLKSIAARNIRYKKMKSSSN